MILYYLNILFSSLAMGGALVARRYLNPPSLEDAFESYLNFHQQILIPLDRYLAVFSGLSGVVAMTLLANHHIWTYLPTKLILEGCIWQGIAFLILVSVLRRVNRKIGAWHADDPPADWKDGRALWLKWHSVHFIFAFLAFSFYVMAALIIHSL
jgi:hypothetical protein